MRALREGTFHPVARLQTHRCTHELLDQGDGVLVEVDDDTVRATSRNTASPWREVEIEVGENGTEDLLALLVIDALSSPCSRAGVGGLVEEHG